MAWTFSLYDGATYTDLATPDQAGTPLGLANSAEQSSDMSIVLLVGDGKAVPAETPLRAFVTGTSLQGLMDNAAALYAALEAAVSVRLTDGTHTYTRALAGFAGMREVGGRKLAALRLEYDLRLIFAAAYWTYSGASVQIGV